MKPHDINCELQNYFGFVDNLDPVAQLRVKFDPWLDLTPG